MPLDNSYPKWERVAFACGAEAEANGRHSMNGDDRLDIAIAYGEPDEKFVNLPMTVRDRAMELFWQGARAERDAAKSFK